ncbi:MAG TPA: hypothetical protein VHW44_13205 [Pseudonocardiaceae bacterium]|nr:hypothetical protein [Pseudonocardiaceae bacterium]
MSGRELIPPGRENLPVLPGTVAAAHLAACAAELAASTGPTQVAECVGSVAELDELIDRLVAGQQHVSATLDQLADHLLRTSIDAPESAQLTALAEVLHAAATATGHAAGALAASGPVLDLVRENDELR